MLSNLLLFIASLAGGSVPLWWRGLTDARMQLVLAFSGSFLLAITFLHLLPESFTELPGQAGIYLLGGFFLQLFIQRFTHGIEHGHVHVSEPASGAESGHQHGSVAFLPVLVGLSVHALMEGFPLGFQYRQHGTGQSLYLAVAAHKMPEAALITSLAIHLKSRRQGWLVLILFSLLTPLGSILATYFGHHYMAMSRAVTALIPVVAGAFVHIATTIFFESGTKQHSLTWQKAAAIAIGMVLGILSLSLE